MDYFKKFFAFTVVFSIIISLNCVVAVPEEEEEEISNINRIKCTIDGTDHTFRFSTAPNNGAYGYFVAEELPAIHNQYNMVAAKSSVDYQNSRNMIIVGFIEGDPGVWDLIIAYFITGPGDRYQFEIDDIDLALLINRDTIGAQMTFTYSGSITSNDTFHTITNIDCSAERM